jgi:hypothetical protein
MFNVVKILKLKNVINFVIHLFFTLRRSPEPLNHVQPEKKKTASSKLVKVLKYNSHTSAI